VKDSIKSYGFVETVVCPYGREGRGEHNRGFLEVWIHPRGYPGYAMISVANTDDRCPPRATMQNPRTVAQICMRKSDAIAFKDALVKIIKELPDDANNNFGEDRWSSDNSDEGKDE
jgi:hypothetical protein